MVRGGTNNDGFGDAPAGDCPPQPVPRTYQFNVGTLSSPHDGIRTMNATHAILREFADSPKKTAEAGMSANIVALFEENKSKGTRDQVHQQLVPGKGRRITEVNLSAWESREVAFLVLQRTAPLCDPSR